MRLEDLQGQQLGRYQITGLLGRGGMAAVYRAHDAALRRDVALKVLYPQYAGDTDLVERFQREAVLAANLDHPNILPIYDVGETDGLVYIAMRLLSGSSFADLLRLRGSLPPAELVPVIDQIASALDYAHARQIVHRDIKPANIMIEAINTDGSTAPISTNPAAPITNARAMLTDFGIAKSLGSLASGLTATGIMIGTPEYMAPEQIRGDQQIDGRADIYALGVLVYRALTGRRPFEGGTQEVLFGHLQGDFPNPSEVNPALPPAIDAVVRTALARDPADRYHSAGEFARALRAAAGLGIAASPVQRHAQNNRPAAQPPVTSSADQATRKGVIVPNMSNPNAPARNVTAPRQQEPAAYSPPRRPATPPPAERRAGGAAWAILGVLLALIIGGGMLYATGLLARNGGSGAVIATAVPSNPPAPTEPAATPAEAPTEPAVTPTEAPTEPAPTEPATAIPSAAPSPTPTARPTARATATATTAPTPSPTAEPSPTDPPTATVAPSPTPNPLLQGGFKLLWEQNPAVRDTLGSPNSAEEGGPGTATEQQYEHGSMFYFQPDTKTNTNAIIYVLFDASGTDSPSWKAFRQRDLANNPTPAPNDCKAPQQNSFALLWGNDENIQQELGCSTTTEPKLFEGARQQFEKGTLLYSKEGLGKGKTIYLLSNDGEFQRFDDPNP